MEIQFFVKINRKSINFDCLLPSFSIKLTDLTDGTSQINMLLMAEESSKGVDAVSNKRYKKARRIDSSESQLSRDVR